MASEKRRMSVDLQSLCQHGRMHDMQWIRRLAKPSAFEAVGMQSARVFAFHVPALSLPTAESEILKQATASRPSDTFQTICGFARQVLPAVRFQAIPYCSQEYSLTLQPHTFKHACPMTHLTSDSLMLSHSLCISPPSRSRTPSDSPSAPPTTCT